MNFHHRQDAIFAIFLILSLLLHLFLLKLLPDGDLWLEPQEKKPVVVEMRPPQVRERELDLPKEPDQERPRDTPAKRLGPSDQVVARETAPKGDAPEDRPPTPPPIPKPQPSEPLPPKGDEGPRQPVDPAKLDLNLPQTTVARYQEEWRRKYRADVEEGKAVWLDTEKDVLLSFFQRFRNNIYNVWNYPQQAAERGEKGTCLLRITINRDGSVDEVKLLEKSGYDTLDREAVAAVYRGATYGALPAAFEGETLQIMAFFQYNLSYGGRRGGDIFGAR
jgi:protein TonB